MWTKCGTTTCVAINFPNLSRHRYSSCLSAHLHPSQMSYTDGQFDAALDKGTLDALLVSEESEVVERVQAMFTEVCRCLRLGGRYIIISLLQDHVQRTLLEYFTKL